MSKRTSEQVKEIESARRYVERCEDYVTASLHCEDEVFLNAQSNLRRAQIHLYKLEGKFK